MERREQRRRRRGEKKRSEELTEKRGYKGNKGRGKVKRNGGETMELERRRKKEPMEREGGNKIGEVEEKNKCGRERESTKD